MSALPKTSPWKGLSGTKLLTCWPNTGVWPTANTPQHAEETSEVLRGMFPNSETPRSQFSLGHHKLRRKGESKSGLTMANTERYLIPTVKAGVERRNLMVEGGKSDVRTGDTIVEPIRSLKNPGERAHWVGLPPDPEGRQTMNTGKRQTHNQWRKETEVPQTSPKSFHK